LHLQAPFRQLKNWPAASQFSQASPQTVWVSGLHAPPPQLLKPVLQLIPQAPEMQVEAPFESPGQGLQFDPHEPGLVSERQLPLQL